MFTQNHESIDFDDILSGSIDIKLRNPGKEDEGASSSFR